MSEIRQDILIPRRPLWDETTTKEQLDRAEKDSFLIWRRELAEKEELTEQKYQSYDGKQIMKLSNTELIMNMKSYLIHPLVRNLSNLPFNKKLVYSCYLIVEEMRRC